MIPESRSSLEPARGKSEKESPCIKQRNGAQDLRKRDRRRGGHLTNPKEGSVPVQPCERGEGGKGSPSHIQRKRAPRKEGMKKSCLRSKAVNLPIQTERRTHYPGRMTKKASGNFLGTVKREESLPCRQKGRPRKGEGENDPVSYEKVDTKGGKKSDP